MKKTIICLAAFLLALSFTPNESKAAFTSDPTEMRNDSMPSESQLVDRLNEIKTMDMSTLSRSERRVLRKEVTSIDKTLRATNGGIYISVGGLIIILLLLIILL